MPEQISHKTSKLIKAERILIGIGNAVTWVPRKQEQWLYGTVYEKYIFPRLTAVQKKQAKALEPNIRKAAKAGGWIMTGGEVIIAGVIAKKITQYVKERRKSVIGVSPGVSAANLPDLHNPGSPAGDARDALQLVGSARTADVISNAAPDVLPEFIGEALPAIGKQLRAGLRDIVHPADIPEMVADAEFTLGTLMAYGMPPDVANLFAGMRAQTEDAEIHRLGLQGFLRWGDWVREQGGRDFDRNDLTKLILVFQKAGFGLLGRLDLPKLRGADNRHALPVLLKRYSKDRDAKIARAAIAASEVVARAVQAAPPGIVMDDIRMLKGGMVENISAAAYEHFLQTSVNNRVNAESSRTAQLEALRQAYRRFMEYSLRPERLYVMIGRELYAAEYSDFLSCLAGMGVALKKLGYPGVQMLGMRLKQA